MSCPDAPFPPQGPSGWVPLLLRYYEALRLPAARPARGFATVFHSVALASTVPPPVSRSSLPASAETQHPRAWRIWVGLPRAQALRGGDGRVSQVPRGSLLRVRHALRPRSSLGARPFRRLGAAPAPAQERRPRASDITELNRTASALPVYASQGGSPHHHATLGSGCWPSSTGGIRTHRDPYVRFLRDVTSWFPSHLGLPGASAVVLVSRRHPVGKRDGQGLG